MTTPESILLGAGDRVHLQREKAIVSLEHAIDDKKVTKSDANMIETLQSGSLALCASDQWEQRLGGLRIANVLISKNIADPAYMDNATQLCIDLLEDHEVRVRAAVGDLLKVLSRHLGLSVWHRLRDPLYISILNNFDRDQIDPPTADNTHQHPISTENQDPIMRLLQQSYKIEPPGIGEMRHGTEGWKCLETSFKALQNIMEGSGTLFKPCADASLRTLLYKALLHPNRFVREAGHRMLGSLCYLLQGEELRDVLPEIASKLGLGLSDSWSQVRYAAAVATRCYVLCTQDCKDEALPLVLPYLCFNRYYPAEGVKRHCQETWHMAVGQEGRTWVAQCAPHVVSYYIEQSRTNDHDVKEASCTCISELITKVDESAVRPFVPRLLRALLSCFKDPSWTVRDAACLACGACVAHYPEESKDLVQKLYVLWFEHLSDNVGSVREGAAIALANAVRGYGNDAVDKIVAKVDEMMERATTQPKDGGTLCGTDGNYEGGSRRRRLDVLTITLRNTTNDTTTANSGMKNANENRSSIEYSDNGSHLSKGNDDTIPPPLPSQKVVVSRTASSSSFKLNSNEPRDRSMFAHGNLAPKLRKQGGCADFEYSREKEPWEYTDGCIYMIRELSHVAPDRIPYFLPKLATISRMNHFSSYVSLQQTLWKCLPDIISHIGKKKFMPFFEDFIDALLNAASCDHRLCQVSAEKCMDELKKMIGPGIFEGRLTEHQKKAYDEVMRMRVVSMHGRNGSEYSPLPAFGFRCSGGI